MYIRSIILISTLLMLGQAATAETVTVEGVVKQAECSRSSGNGIVAVQIKNGKTLIQNWYKVKSQALCTESTALIELAYANTMNRLAEASILTIENGFLINITPAGKTVDQHAMIQNVNNEIQNDISEVHDWYFNVRRRY